MRSGILEPRNRRLSVKGRNAIRDLRAWIEAIADEAENKNGEDEVQQFIWEISQADVDVGTAPLPPYTALQLTPLSKLYFLGCSDCVCGRLS